MKLQQMVRRKHHFEVTKPTYSDIKATEQNRSKNNQNRSRSRHMKLITYKEGNEIQYQRYKCDNIVTTYYCKKKTTKALKEFNEKDACTFP